MADTTNDPNLDLLSDFRWPQDGDLLVTHEGDPSYLVHLQADEDRETFITAFKMAADMLVERTHESRSINWLIFPIWYLYRHQRELSLKSLIWDGDALAGRPRRLLKTHELKPLWQQCRKDIEKWLNDYSRADLDAVAATLLQFHDIDPYSQAGRYESDAYGNRSGLLGREINVKTFVETTKKTVNFLAIVSDQLRNLQCSSFEEEL